MCRDRVVTWGRKAVIESHSQRHPRIAVGFDDVNDGPGPERAAFGCNIRVSRAGSIGVERTSGPPVSPPPGHKLLLLLLHTSGGHASAARVGDYGRALGFSGS